jgi:enamine deaminase RidA (YjgF/YER057c/UK114 family)
MAVLQHVVAPDGVAPGRGYSQAVSGRGRLVVSGQIAQDERGELAGGIRRRRRGRYSTTCAGA